MRVLTLEELSHIAGGTQEDPTVVKYEGGPAGSGEGILQFERVEVYGNSSGESMNITQAITVGGAIGSQLGFFSYAAGVEALGTSSLATSVLIGSITGVAAGVLAVVLVAGLLYVVANYTSGSGSSGNPHDVPLTGIP